VGRAVYGHYDDIVGYAATVTVNSGTEDPDYPADYLVDQVVVRPAQLLTGSGAWLLAYPSPQRWDWVAIPMHNLDAGLEVRIQGNATDSWGSPTLNVPIIIPPYRDDGFPVGCWLDLTTATGYTDAGFAFWRLAVVGTNSANVKVGELVAFERKRTLNPNISWGARILEDRPIVDNRTPSGAENIYDRGVTRQELHGELDTTDAGLAAVRAWWRSSRGRARPMGLVPDEDVNEAWLARFQNQMDPTLEVTDRNRLALHFEEASRGLVL
jgi:hypothetical protein